MENTYEILFQQTEVTLVPTRTGSEQFESGPGMVEASFGAACASKLRAPLAVQSDLCLAPPARIVKPDPMNGDRNPHSSLPASGLIRYAVNPPRRRIASKRPTTIVVIVWFLTVP